MQATIETDAELLQLMSAGDQHAFQNLYERYWQKIYDYTVHKVELQETAEEIVQDIFIDLWKRREQLIIERFDSYLYRAAKNRVIDALRAGMVRKHHESYFELIRVTDKQKLDAEEELAYTELYSAIHEGLSLLPQKTSEIFRLNRLDQLSAREISTLLDVPVRTVEYHITHALRTMKVYLQDFLILIIGVLLYLR